MYGISKNKMYRYINVPYMDGMGEMNLECFLSKPIKVGGVQPTRSISEIGESFRSCSNFRELT